MAFLTLFMAGVVLVFCLQWSSSFSQGSPQPNIEVTPTVFRDSDTVQLKCVTSQPAQPAECFFYYGVKGETPSSQPCQVSVKAQDLLHHLKQTSPAEINVTCSYIITDSQSQRRPSDSSRSATLAVLGPPPQMLMDVTVEHGADVALLECGTLHPPPVSGCHFYFVGKEVKSRHAAACQLTISRRDLISWQGQDLPMKLHMGCFYAERRSGIHSLHEMAPSVKVIGTLPRPIVSVNVQTQDDIISTACEIPRSFDDVISCDLFIAEHLHASIKSKPLSKKDQSHCMFYVSRADLLKHLQSARGEGLSCSYTVNTEPPTHSQRSDKYIIPDRTLGGSSPTTKNPLASSKSGSSHTTKNPLASSKSGFAPMTERPQTESDPDIDRTLGGSSPTTKKPLAYSKSESSPTTKNPLASSKSGSSPTTKNPLASGVSCTPYQNHTSTGTSSKDGSQPKWLIVAFACSMVITLLGLLAFCFHRKLKGLQQQQPVCNSSMTRQNQHVDMTPLAVCTARRAADTNTGTYSMISPVSPISASDEGKKEDLCSKQDDENTYHVYCSIPDTPSVSNQSDQIYSSLQDHRGPEVTQQDMTYSLLQMH